MYTRMETSIIRGTMLQMFHGILHRVLETHLNNFNVNTNLIQNRLRMLEQAKSIQCLRVNYPVELSVISTKLFYE